MIKRVELIRFKKFKEKTFEILPNGMTLLVGGNNAGKSTLIHALAVWEFCKVYLLHEKGRAVFNMNTFDDCEGLGMSAEEFLPIAVPSLNHLWTNLKTQLSPAEKKELKDNDVSYPGYIMRIKCVWDNDGGEEKYLEIGLSLVNDRLFIRITNSNLNNDDHLPNIVYLPTFAGVLPKENRITIADRRAYLGKGMAGSIIRNMIYDLYLKHEEIRKDLLGTATKLTALQKNQLLEVSPLEKLQNNLRRTFSSQLEIEPFSESFHTILRVHERKVTKDTAKPGVFEVLSKSDYHPRDIITQGSGFLQWLSIFAIIYSSDVDVVLLDEPDAHLHACLQRELFEQLCLIANAKDDEKKQILISTHSVEMIKQAPLPMVYSMDNYMYLESEDSRVSVLEGVGSEYFPKIDLLTKHKKLIFVENDSDKNLLTSLGALCGIEMPQDIVYWANTYSHAIRKKIYIDLKKSIPDLKCISLRDRDNDDINRIAPSLNKKDEIPKNDDSILILEWRRRNIESYFLCPNAIAKASGKSVDDIQKHIREKFALAIPDSGCTQTDAPEPILACDGKRIFTADDIGIQKVYGVDKYAVAKHMTANEVCEDIKTFLSRSKDHFSS